MLLQSVRGLCLCYRLHWIPQPRRLRFDHHLHWDFNLGISGISLNIDGEEVHYGGYQ